MGRGLNGLPGLGGVRHEVLLKFDEAAHSDETVLSSDAVRCRSRAVGHARTARRAAATAALFHEAVPAFATRKGIGCLRALRSFGRRNGILFVGQGALSKLLRETHRYLLSYWERNPETTSFWWVNSAPSVEHREFTDENDIRLGVPLNDTHPRSELSLGETPKRQEATPGYGSANQRGEAARRTGGRNETYPEEPGLPL